MIDSNEPVIIGKLRALKIQLTVFIEKLIEKGQQNFARHISLNLKRLVDESAHLVQPVNAVVVNTITNCLQQIENILLACKLGVGLGEEEKVLAMVRTSKAGMQTFN